MYDLTWQSKVVWRSVAGSEVIPDSAPDPDITSAAVLVWEEHCVECAMPECYANCPLYVRRADQKCARFAYGVYPHRGVRGLFGFGADVTFRRWAKLETELPGRPRVWTRQALRWRAAAERSIERAASVASDLLQPIDPKRHFNRLVTRWRSRNKDRGAPAGAPCPDALFVKFYNPSNEPGELTIEAHQEQLVFRDSIPFAKGWNERAIPYAALRLDPVKRARLLVAPANDKVTRLVFTWLDLVVFAGASVSQQVDQVASPKSRPAPASKVKCVVWDLDNTLWRGVIGDAGPDGVVPSPDALSLVHALDERGIIQSVASKNDHDLAWHKIETLGLADYFLYPAIHWAPKSQSVRSIADRLNIGVDTLAFIDDSAFERAEVSGALPQVRVYDATDIPVLLEKPELDVPVTEMSRLRRLTYLEEARRQRVAATWGDDYDGFLRSCGMSMRIGRPRPEQVARCLELIQRTNQLNLSSRRYDEAAFRRLLANDRFETFAFDCADRFGQYGLVGFASVERDGAVPVLRDFVLSCRVAQKRVEEAFVRWYGHRSADRGIHRLHIALVPTDRNRPLRDAFARLPLTLVASSSAEETYELSLKAPFEVQDVVRIEEAA